PTPKADTPGRAGVGERLNCWRGGRRSAAPGSRATPPWARPTRAGPCWRPRSPSAWPTWTSCWRSRCRSGAGRSLGVDDPRGRLEPHDLARAHDVDVVLVEQLQAGVEAPVAGVGAVVLELVRAGPEAVGVPGHGQAGPDRDPGLVPDHAVVELVDDEQLLGQPVAADDAGDIGRGPVDGGGVGAAQVPARHLPGAHGELGVEGDADIRLAQVRLPVAHRAEEVVLARLHVQDQHPVEKAESPEERPATGVPRW